GGGERQLDAGGRPRRDDEHHCGELTGADYTRSMRTARAAALRALSTPTVATGTPGGICAIARSASRPSSTLRLDLSGTPITGRSVCAATAPGRASASPAPQIRRRSPPSPAVGPYSP